MVTVASRHVYTLSPGVITCVERDLLIFGVISCSQSGCTVGERAKSANKRKDGQLRLLQDVKLLVDAGWIGSKARAFALEE